MKGVQSMRILTVEDEESTATVMRMLLELKLEAYVDTASDCASAREYLSSNSYDLVTLDYQLPDGDGLCLLGEMIGKEKAPPVVMVTAHGDEQTAVSAFKLGASGYVVKDARMSTMLVEEARSALARARLEAADEALRDSEEKYHALYESCADGIVVVSPEGNILDANKSYLEMLGGYTIDEIRNLTQQRLTPEKWRDFERDVVMGQVLSRGYSDEYEKENIRKDGTVLPVSFRAWSIKDNDGRLVGTWGFARDITERKAAGEALRFANAELANYALTVSHDLKGPLTSIAAVTDVLAILFKEEEGSGPEGDTGEALRLIRESTRRAITLTESLLELALAGGMPERPMPSGAPGVVPPVPEMRKPDIMPGVAGARSGGSLEAGGAVAAQTPRSMENLQVGDHLCCIYETEEQHRDLLTPYMLAGLRSNQKVVYIVDARAAEVVLGYLEDAGVDAEKYLKSGQLAILTVDETYMRGGVFDPDGMIDLLRSDTEKALVEGYDGLRVTGEMSWALKDLPGSERLFEYEARLNEFFPGSRALAICQYDRRVFGADILLSMMTTHPMVVIGTEVYDCAYFIPTAELLGPDASSTMLGHWTANIRQRRELETLARDENLRAESYLDAAGAMIVVLDGSGNIALVNRTGLEMLGYGEGELLGKSWFETCLPGRAREEAEGIFASIFAGEAQQSAEVESFVLTSTGEEKLVAWRSRALTDSEGRIVATVSTGEDITERRAVEEVLRRANAELETYARTVSHDLKGPLSSVKTTADILTDMLREEDGLDPAGDAGEALEIMKRSASRAIRLTDDLLALARAGHTPERTLPVDVSEAVRSILEERGPDIEARGARVRIDGDLGVVAMDGAHTYQVFSNLIVNALQRNGSTNPVVMVERLGSPEGGSQRYRVRDNGSGIPEELMETLFDPFVSGNSVGTGIGLTIVSKVVHLYGGQVRAYNDRGACFEFTLPVQA